MTRIPKWKFDLLRAAILDAFEAGALDLSELKDAVAARLGAEHRAALGSLGWHVTTVKLELEVRGEIERLTLSGPQRLMLAGRDEGASSPNG